MYGWRSILITGASSGLGAALARALAVKGAFLALTGRDAGRLEEVAHACRTAGADVLAETVDVRDRVAMADFVGRADGARPLDLAIANAGISAGTQGGPENADQTRAIFAVNVDGVANTVLPALSRMAPRASGQVAIMSSLASFRGLPGAPAYCASKAAVRVWGEALRADWRNRGIRVNVVCPGFVVSRMTAANDFPMPMLMETAPAAERILRGLSADRPRIAFPWPMYVTARLLAALPMRLADPVLARLPKKS
jgi:short-subunit dehydrogenase